MLSNYPAGVTDADIDDHFGSETESQLADRFAGIAVHCANNWDGCETHELLADILEATQEDFVEVLAKARGEIELRARKRRKAGK